MDGKTVYLTSEIKRHPFREIPVRSPVISYFGNIRLGRNESLREIGDALGRIDSSYILNVYSNEKDEHYIGIFDGSRNVKFCGTVPYSEVMKKSAESDILIVVEGFKKKDVDITRYSLSTKVADSLSSGAAVFAYGSAECGAIEYAESTGCITTCTDKDMLEVSLRSLIYDTELQRRNYEKGITVVENNHRLENSTGIFESVVNGVCGDL